ncbi:MAG: Sapep family Mn(2+)-dependent dipeptidase, partial [Eubacteriales bacterium]|nr:Sapep family Mn(2+)-dependent dipeptidase [Eubacteriales bacterium]
TAHCDMPKTGFSPDASYPVINTEKGMLELSLHAAPAKDGLVVRHIAVGERKNVIPGQASAIIEGGAAIAEKANALAREMTLDAKATVQPDGTVLLETQGIPGHAAYPEPARNANGMLLLMLRALGVTGALRKLADCVGMEYNGASMNAACSDHTSGPLTCNLGILRYDAENGLYATLDIRYPLLANPVYLYKAIDAALAPDVQVKQESQKDPHHVAPSSALVTALLDAYHEETGRPRECVATGGGTYARCLAEGVAFGASFPEDEDRAHQANEMISLNSLMLNVRIIARAILKLAGA